MSIKKCAFLFAVAAMFLFSCGEKLTGSSDHGGDGGGNTPAAYTLTVGRIPAAGGSVTVNGVTSAGTTSHNIGASVNVCAVTNSGYTFTGWSGASVSTNSCVSVTMNANQTLFANFQQTANVANAVFVTLTRWETQVTELFGDTNLDPRIYFTVSSLSGTSVLSATDTDDLLHADNIGQSWSGSRRNSAAIPIHASATELRIRAVVIERDLALHDDISPSQVLILELPRSVGSTLMGRTLGNSTGSESRVTFNLEFVRR